MSTTATTGTSNTDDILRMDRTAFDATASARAAMTPEDAPHYGLDAIYAAGIALGIAQKVAPYREQMLTLPSFDIACLDGFEDLARALRFVNKEIVRRIEGTKALPGLAEEGWKLRDVLMRFADLLVTEGLFNAELIARLKEGSGYRDLVEDLTVLAGELEALPPAYITGPGALVTREKLARAMEIADQINTAAGIGTVIDLPQSKLLEERRKLGLMLTRAHSQIRRGIIYLRWDQGDAAELVPSLYVAGPGRPKNAKPAEPEQDLAAIHQELHEHMPLVDPEDNPFSEE